MSQIECYEPAFIRHYRAQYPAAIRQPLVINWQHEARCSLLLDDPDCCEAVLGSPEAFVLQVKMTEAVPGVAALPKRLQVINQAALDIVTLPDLSVDLRLYALGVMLSYAQKLPADSDDALETLKSLPQRLAGYAADGTLAEMFAQLPVIAGPQRQLISSLGRLSFDWDRLVDCTRKMSLPLQLSLLALADSNSEALMQQQLLDVWASKGQQAFAGQPWIWTNYLVYRLYHETFPRHEQHDMLTCYLQLVSDYFLLRSLFSLWLMDGSPLSPSQAISLFSVFESWRLDPQAAAGREALLSDHDDPLLAAISLLVS